MDLCRSQSALLMRTVSEDNITGIDWASSHTSTPYNVEGITVPLLISQHSGHYFIVVGERIYDHAKSADKELVFIYGANHGGSACTRVPPTTACLCSATRKS
jgi:hypothetical protein